MLLLVCTRWCSPTVTFEIWSMAEAVPAVHVVTIVCLQLVVLEEIMLPKLLLQTYWSQFHVLVAVGPVVKHTLVVQVWDVRVTPTDITYLNFRAVGGCGGWMCNGDAWGPKTYPFWL